MRKIKFNPLRIENPLWKSKSQRVNHRHDSHALKF